MTPLDQAHEAMLADPEDDAARLRYYRLLADADLYLLLEDEAVGETMRPRLFPLDDGPVVLAFDSEERLVDFTGIAVAYAALPGRVIVAQLRDQGIGLGVNLGSPDQAWLMAPHAVDWLAGVLDQGPVEKRGRPLAVDAPGALDPALAEALAVAISGAGGLAAHAVLVAAIWSETEAGYLLAYFGAAPEAEAPLARALAEALAFSGFENGLVDVAFLQAGDAGARQLLSLGQALSLPAPPAAPPERAPPAPPGMDPDRPPRLR